MTKRVINKTLIRALVKENGIERVAVGANCSASLLQKLMQDGYEALPTIAKIDGLCFYSGKTINDLFPFDQEKEEAAS